MICAPPYVRGNHWVGNIGGGEGENYPVYLCNRQHPANHIGAIKCATGFAAAPKYPHPTSHTSYRCRLKGLEPNCGAKSSYYAVKKTIGGWYYRCH